MAKLAQMWQFHPRDLPDSHQHIYITHTHKKSILKASRPCGKNWFVFSELSFQLLHNYIWTCHNISLWNHNLETSKKTIRKPEAPPQSTQILQKIVSWQSTAVWGYCSISTRHFELTGPFLEVWTSCLNVNPTGGSQSSHNFLFPVFEAYRTKQTHSTVPAATEQNPKSLDPSLVNENYPLRSVRSRILDCIIYLYIYKDIYMYIYKSKEIKMSHSQHQVSFLFFGKWLMQEQEMQWLKMTQHPQKKWYE